MNTPRLWRRARADGHLQTRELARDLRRRRVGGRVGDARLATCADLGGFLGDFRRIRRAAEHVDDGETLVTRGQTARVGVKKRRSGRECSRRPHRRERLDLGDILGEYSAEVRDGRRLGTQVGCHVSGRREQTYIELRKLEIVMQVTIFYVAFDLHRKECIRGRADRP